MRARHLDLLHGVPTKARLPSACLDTFWCKLILSELPVRGCFSLHARAHFMCARMQVGQGRALLDQLLQAAGAAERFYGSVE